MCVLLNQFCSFNHVKKWTLKTTEEKNIKPSSNAFHLQVKYINQTAIKKNGVGQEIFDVHRINNECKYGAYTHTIHENKKKEIVLKYASNVSRCFFHRYNVMGITQKRWKKGNMHICMRIGSARSIAVNYRYQTSENTQTDRIARMQVLLLLFHLLYAKFLGSVSQKSAAWLLDQQQKTAAAAAAASTALFALTKFIKFHTLVAFYIFLSVMHTHSHVHTNERLISSFHRVLNWSKKKNVFFNFFIS